MMNNCTIKDIAGKAGVGLATVSSYLNGGSLREKNRLAIQQAIDELGYEVNEVARNLRTQKTRSIGVIVPDFCNSFFMSIITALEDSLRKSGYSMIICDCRSDVLREKEAIDFLIKKRVDGFVIIPVSTDAELTDEIAGLGKPFVFVDRTIAGIDAASVTVDNFDASKRATLRLIECGHRDIAIIYGNQDVITAVQRLNGYKAALQESGITIDKSLMACGHNTIRGAEIAMQQILDTARPTAVFATNYEMTVGANIILSKLGVKIPDEISFIGYDNVDYAKAMRPSLTIITQPAEEMGMVSAQRIVSLCENGSSSPQGICLKSTFIEGKSILKI